MSAFSREGRAPRLILLAASRSYRAPAFLEAAARLGAEVVIGEDVPLPLLGQSDAALSLDYRDLVRSTEAIRRYAKARPVDALVGLDDSGTVLAARASAALGLPHNSPGAVEASRSKRLMRERFAEAGVPSPRFRVFCAGEDPWRIAAEVAFPCVLKPTMLSGSRGVMRADDPGEFAERWARLCRILAAERCDEALVEDYVPGAEVALEGLLERGRLRVLALFDKPDPLEGPFFDETLYVTPSRLPGPVQDALAGAAEWAAASLGLREGPVHAELRWNDRGPWLVEVAARTIGGLCSRTLRFGAGLSLEDLVLRHALGLPVQASRETKAAGVMMIPIPRAGMLRAVSGVEEARGVPLVEGVEITARPNYPLVPLPEGDSYVGFIFARADTPEDVEAALREAHSRLRFEVATEIALEVRT